MPISVNFPYTFSPGNVISSAQVNANNAAINTALAAAATTASPTFSGTVTISGFTSGYLRSGATGVIASQVPASALLTPSGSFLQGSTTAQMLGTQAGLVSIVPVMSGRVLVIFNCNAQPLTSGASTLGIRAGVGAGPAAATAASGTGTLYGTPVSMNSAAGAPIFPVSLAVLIAGLALGQNTWVDLQATTAAGSLTVTNVSIDIAEI